MDTMNMIRTSAASQLAAPVEQHLQAAILAADLSSEAGIYAIEGMSGKRYRYFINNLVRAVPDARYLEIGSWAGSTLCSAIHGNKVRAVAIDNWSEFGGPKQIFLKNVQKFRTPDAEVIFLESDFRKVDYTKMNSYNIYLFDGPHSEQDQYDGLAMALPCMDQEFVFIVDDWNWERVRLGTTNAIRRCGLEVLFSAEIRTSVDNTQPALNGKHSDWHNGYFISVLRKPAFKQVIVD